MYWIKKHCLGLTLLTLMFSPMFTSTSEATEISNGSEPVAFSVQWGGGGGYYHHRGGGMYRYGSPYRYWHGPGYRYYRPGYNYYYNDPRWYYYGRPRSGVQFYWRR